MRYFTDCKTAEELKKEYHKLCKQLHPDNGGDENEFKDMQAEFKKAWDKLKNIHVNKEGETYSSETTETAEDFMNIINRVITFENVLVELCGSWLWISGDTKPYKEELKNMGARWSHNKNCWYYHTEPYKRYHNKNYSLDDIRLMYGSVEYKKTEKEQKKKISDH